MRKSISGDSWGFVDEKCDANWKSHRPRDPDAVLRNARGRTLPARRGAGPLLARRQAAQEHRIARRVRSPRRARGRHDRLHREPRGLHALLPGKARPPRRLQRGHPRRSSYLVGDLKMAYGSTATSNGQKNGVNRISEWKLKELM